jgi:hypothetical protein
MPITKLVILRPPSRPKYLSAVNLCVERSFATAQEGGRSG